jgi:iron complex outermembrane receptor protein
MPMVFEDTTLDAVTTTDFQGEKGMSIPRNKLAWCLRRSLLGGIALTLAMPVLADTTADATTTPANQAQATTAPANAKKKSEPATLDTVVVTAQSRDQSLQVVPITVNVVTGRTIDQVAANDLGDLDIFVPGLVISSVSPTQPRYTIRGISTDDFGIGTDPAVGVYIDGVYSARSGGALLALDDVERVEVLKGPQGTLFGRNSAAGAISIITNKPGDEFEGRTRVRLGNEGRRYFDALFNVPTGEHSALRFSVLRNLSDGWLRDAATGQRYGGDDNWATRAVYRWDASDKTELLLSWDHEVVDQLARPVIGIVDLPPAPGLPEFPADPTHFRDPFSVPVYNDVVGNEESRRFNGVTLSVNHSFDWAKFVSTTAWRGFQTVNREDEDGTNRINLYFDTANREHNRSFYQEFKFSGANDRADWVAGASYYDEHARQASETNAFTDSIDTVLLHVAGLPVYSLVNQFMHAHGIPLTLFGDPWRETMFNDGGFKAYAAFGDVIWHLTDRVNLTTGLRYTYDSKRFSWFNGPRVAPELDATIAQLDQLGFWNSNPLLPLARDVFESDIVFDLGDLENQLIERKKSWSDFSPRVVLDYRPSDKLMWFGSVTKGYKAGGFNSVEVGSQFQNEDVWNYEAGFKSSFPAQRLQFDGSVYYYLYKNKQSIRLDPNSAGSGVPRYLIDTADEQAWGIDFESSWRATDALAFQASLAYIDSTFKRGTTDTGVDLSGQPTTEPYLAVSIGGNYRWQTRRGDVEFSLLHGYRSKGRCNSESVFQGDCSASPSFQVGAAQNRTDVRVDWTSPNQVWDLAVYGNNVFDNRYVIEVSNLTTSVFGTAAATVTPPRTWGLEATARF